MKQNPLSLIRFKTTTPPFLIAIALLFACFWSLPTARAVSPAPDGGYPGGNTAEGQNALLRLTTGGYNTAVGFLSLGSEATGSFNTGLGAGTLLANVGDPSAGTGEENTATGAGALLSNTTGFQNTANGAFALFLNTTGALNTAIGAVALQSNTTGFDNTAIGHSVLPRNTTGNYNTAIAPIALQFNTEGSSNTAIGYDALQDNITGNSNTAIGDTAGWMITGDGNVCIGAEVAGADGVNDTTWIKNVYDSVANGRAVYVNADNKLGTLSSSQRYKDEIKPMAKASEAILSLKPVTFRYKKEVDPRRSLSFGLIAEEVVQVDRDLVTTDRDGKPQTVRYEAVNAMLLNEFLKAHSKLQQQEATISQLKSIVAKQETTDAEQQKEIQALAAIVKEEASQIQRVSAQLELQKDEPRSVLNQTANAEF